MRRSLLAMLLLVAGSASATSSRVFVPVAGQTVNVDTLRLDVLDVQANHSPAGAPVTHWATVRATDHGVTRTITVSLNPGRVDVLEDHAIVLLEQPLRLSITPAPPVAVGEHAASSIARARATSLGWSTAAAQSSSLLVRGATWEISFHLAEDLDGVVEIDARTGRVIRASERGGM